MAKAKKEDDFFEESTPKSNKVTVEFADDVSADTVQKAMEMATRMSNQGIANTTKVLEKRAEYEKEGNRRFTCTVHSTQGEREFELIMPDPNSSNPIRVAGRCGVRIEQGLTRYAINALQEAYVIKTKERHISPNDPRLSSSSSYIDGTESYKDYRFNVREHGEVKSPPRAGHIRGSKRSLAAQQRAHE